MRFERRINALRADCICIYTTKHGLSIREDESRESVCVKLIRKNNGWILLVPEDFKRHDELLGDTQAGILKNGCRAVDGVLVSEGDFLSVSGYELWYREGYFWTENRQDIEIVGFDFENSKIMEPYPEFRRSTRIRCIVDSSDITLLAPASLPKRPEGSFAMTVVPALAMMASVGVMAVSGQRMMMLFAGVSAGAGIFGAVFGMLSGRKRHKKELKERESTYRTYISLKKDELVKLRQHELEDLERIYRPIGQDLEDIGTFSHDIFDRSPGDDDFLHVRVGTGRIKALKKLKYQEKESVEPVDELYDLPVQLCAVYEYLDDAPVVIDLGKAGALGILGKQQMRYALLKTIVIDIIARHFYSDVKMVFMADASNKDIIRPFRMIPWTLLGNNGLRGVAGDEEGRTALFEFIYKELSQRKESSESAYHLVVFFYDDCGIRSHPVSRFIPDLKELNASFVFFGERRTEIINGCSSIIEMKDSKNAVILSAGHYRLRQEFTYRDINEKALSKAVRMMVPVYAEEISLENSLVSSYSLYEMLNIQDPEGLDITARWASNSSKRSMAAPLGISGKGVFCLDIHENAHGPHGLIAGTTGSGKSELLQTYIISMAVNYSPEDVGFVLIDFKGGGMAGQLKALPHIMGIVTNLEGNAAERSLRLLKAELVRRQKLFKKAQVNSIDRYIESYKSGRTIIALPHLVIVVDEFAELKAEHPEFMKELISAARIGRSLGVHLILATQKPSGQISEQIWSNSRFRICLKVQSGSDSNEVLKSPLAAEIKEPGRAYIQVGNNEVFELIQSAYSSCSADVSHDRKKPFDIYKVSDWGRRTLSYTSIKGNLKPEKVPAQSEEIIRFVSETCRSHSFPVPDPVILPPLKDVYCFPGKLPEAREKVVLGETGDKAAIGKVGIYKQKLMINIGVYDNPDEQCQEPFSFDLCAGHVLAAGASMSGKTNLLEIIIRQVSGQFSPEEANIYIIDFGSGALKAFENLRHVGGIVCPGDDEKIKNLMKLLRKEASRRLINKDAGKLIILLIDNLHAFKEMYFKDNSEFTDFCSQCVGTGICVTAVCPKPSENGFRYLSPFSGRICFYCEDQGEPRYMFDRTVPGIGRIPGRCLIQEGNNIYECQTYRAFAKEKTEGRHESEPPMVFCHPHGDRNKGEREQSINEFISETNRRCHTFAEKIPEVPLLLTSDIMYELFGNPANKRFAIYAGVNYEDISAFKLELTDNGILYIAGKNEDEKLGWIRYMFTELERYYSGKYNLYVADGEEGKLAWLNGLNCEVSYSSCANDIKGFLASAENEIAADSEQDNLSIVLINSMKAARLTGADPEISGICRRLMSKCCDMNLCFIVSCIGTCISAVDAPELIRGVKNARNVLYFDDIGSMKLFEVPFSISRAYQGSRPYSDAYYFGTSGFVRIKVPMLVQIRHK